MAYSVVGPSCGALGTPPKFSLCLLKREHDPSVHAPAVSTPLRAFLTSVSSFVAPHTGPEVQKHTANVSKYRTKLSLWANL